MRPVNAAVAPTCGQTGRKESAKREKGVFRGPAIASPGCAAPNPGKGLRSLHSCSLCFLKCACHLAEGEFISIVNWCSLVRLQSLTVDARRVCAVQVGDCIGGSNQLNGGMYG